MVKRALVMLIAAVALLLLPAQAFAAGPGYSIEQLSTELYVETNASVHVVERQTLSFAGESQGLVWLLHQPGDHELVEISSMRVAQLDQDGNAMGEWLPLQFVNLDPETQALQPGGSVSADLRGEGVSPWYSYDIDDGMVRCYFPANAGTYLVETDYTVSDCVSVYRDVSELYWRYAQSNMPVDAHNVSLTIALPVPAGSEIVPDSTVKAWGHGPSDGAFAIGEDGSVTFHADAVLAGHYAEAHVLFPAHWLDNVEYGSYAYHADSRRLDAIAEETDWMDLRARESIWDNKVRVLFAPLVALAAVVAMAFAVAFGRSARTRRWFVRIAATLGIVGLAEQAFFREPITTALLLCAAAVIALLALLLPRDEDVVLESETGES